MTAVSIPGNADFPYVIDDSSATYLVNKRTKLIGSTSDTVIIQESEASKSNVLRIEGTISSTWTALDLMGTGTKLLIGESGMVIGGEAGVHLVGIDQSFVNNGTVRGRVTLGDAENLRQFENNGVIGTIDLGQSTYELVLGRESEIRSSSGLGIGRGAEEGVATTTVNAGLIKASTAFRSLAGDETFINKGTLDGDVELGAGNDTFKSMGKRFAVDIYGGDGDDTYILSNTDASVIEEVGGGNDTVKSKDDFFLEGNSEVETLHLIGKWDATASGNGLANSIVGNSGKNELLGWGGDDTLEGGAGADRFGMRTEWGHDVITDFQVGVDRLVVNNWGEIFELSDIIDLSTEVNGGVLIEQGDDSIFLAGVELAELSARDFFFGSP